MAQGNDEIIEPFAAQAAFVLAFPFVSGNEL